MVVLLSYSCSCIFSFLYQFISIEETSFDYLHRRSKCDYCNSSLKWYELMPIISFLLLKGRCRNCRKRISLTHFLGETFALIPIVFIKYDFTYVNATLFITTYVFLLIFTMTDITSLMLDCRLIIIYCIVSLSLSMIYPVAFIIISMTTHIFYFLFRAYIGYGDVLLISALSLFFPLQFTIYVILFTFVIAG
ncbi:TPA: prepilin peptidase, partial [Staphylococcus aureus]|nr:prepilin peptidase [Staphylococcus aureus]HDH2448992.1 prepilin peptidase [Staphylococcus aureus]